MDIIDSCLNCTPIPYLSTAFAVFRFIWLSVEQIQASKHQLHTLAQNIAQLLNTIDREYRAGRLIKTKTSVPLQELGWLLDDVKLFVQQQADYSFLELFFKKDDRNAKIGEYHQRISMAVSSFEVSALINIQHWQSKNNDARVEDQQKFNIRLNELEKNQHLLMRTLDAQQTNIMAMMVSMQRHLDRRLECDQEHQFLSHSLQFLSTRSGRQVQVEPWMITLFEVDFGPVIGSGGFGQVYKGSWLKTEVALKVLKLEHGETPSPTVISREVKTWSQIRHPHILQFLGANVLDERPFIVMPYLKNGNARDYIQTHPNCDRLKILYHVSLGMVYLHSQGITHGDIKGLNVLIDDNGKALLCDFGLSRMKADASSRSRVSGSTIGTGSRNWMAPEQLLGGAPKTPCDIYAFGMMVFEIYTDDNPLSHISYIHFVDLVVHQNVRPERPDPDEAPGLSDDAWQLAEQCWVKDPLERPKANAACDFISHLITTRGNTPKNLTAQPETSLVPPPAKPNVPALPRAVPPALLAPLDLSLPHQIIPHSPPAYRAPPRTVNVQAPQPSPPMHHLQPPSSPHPPSLPRMPLSEPSDNESNDDSKSNRNSANLSSSSRRVSFSALVKALSLSASSTKSTKSRPSSAEIIPDRPLLQTPELNPVNWAAPLPIPPIIQHNSEIYAIAFSPNGQWIACGCNDQTVRIWEIKTGSRSKALEGHTGSVLSIAYSPDGKWIASGSVDTTIRVWEATTGRCLYGPFKGHTSFVRSVAFSPDGEWIASGSEDKTVRVWNVKAERCVYGPFTMHTEYVLSVSFSPNQPWIASASADKTICLWNMRSGECVSPPFKGHTEWVRSIAFSPDGEWIASGSYDKTIRVWDVKTGNCVFGPFEGHTSLVVSIAFSPDGRWIASGSHDKRVRVWDVKTGISVPEPFQGHTNGVHSVAFSPDGRSIASGSNDNTIRIWAHN